MTRLIALVARGSAMGSVFIFGIIFTAQAGPERASGFFVAYSLTTLLIVLLGMELHTYSDREVASGLSPVFALGRLLALQVPWIGFVSVGCLAGASILRFPLDTAVLVIANASVGLVVQECFRLLVVMGAHSQANLSMVVRNTIPFLGLAVWLMVSDGVDVTVDSILIAWLVGGILASVASFLLIRLLDARDKPDGRQFLNRRALATAARYFPAAVIARSFLSLDVIVVGVTALSATTALYGNGANIAAGFFALADLAVTQWRLRMILNGKADGRTMRLHMRDSFVIAGASFFVIGAGGILAGVGVFGSKYVGPTSVAIGLFLAGGSAGAIVSQALQVRVYALRRDTFILRAYVTAAVPFLVLIILSWLLGDPILSAAARCAGFAVLATCLWRNLTSDGTTR